jgi:hypothetical protein
MRMWMKFLLWGLNQLGEQLTMTLLVILPGRGFQQTAAHFYNRDRWCWRETVCNESEVPFRMAHLLRN